MKYLKIINLLFVSSMILPAHAINEQPYDFGYGGFQVKTNLPILARSKYLDSQNTQLLINQCFNAVNQCKSNNSDREIIELLKQENARLRAELEELK